MHNAKQLSIIIPTYNEDNWIIECIESLLDGDYPLDKIEIVIADGHSTDGTVDRIRKFASEHRDITIKVVNNPDKTQGYGLNLAIQSADPNSEIILRADAHSIYPQNYVSSCAKTLMDVEADNVGGVMVPKGNTLRQKAVAFCMSHPLGVGNAKFHLGDYSGFVDTAYLGCFKRSVFDKAGLFDPQMTPNEDAELNVRIRKTGGHVYLNGNIKVDYFPRDSLVKLLKQYFRYGQGRCRTFKKHKAFTSIRQLVPPLWAVSSFVFLALSLTWPVFAIPLLVYVLTLVIASGYGAFKEHDLAILLSPVCFVIMHYAWGFGLLQQMFARTAKDNKAI